VSERARQREREPDTMGWDGGTEPGQGKAGRSAADSGSCPGSDYTPSSCLFPIQIPHIPPSDLNRSFPFHSTRWIPITGRVELGPSHGHRMRFQARPCEAEAVAEAEVVAEAEAEREGQRRIGQTGHRARQRVFQSPTYLPAYHLPSSISYLLPFFIYLHRCLHIPLPVPNTYSYSHTHTHTYTHTHTSVLISRYAHLTKSRGSPGPCKKCS
jgi:hypothetical protein